MIMGSIHTGLRFTEWALEFMLVPPFCFAWPIAAISLVWAAQRQRPFGRTVWLPYHWLILTHLLFFVAAIVVGVTWVNPITNPTVRHSTNPIASRCLNVVLYGSLLSCAFWIWRAKGFRWYATSLLALAELPTVAAVFVAGMSISGDWL
jgi:hypothetical protein